MTFDTIHKARCTDYGHLIKPFFIEIEYFLAWADKFWGIFKLLQTGYGVCDFRSKKNLLFRGDHFML